MVCVIIWFVWMLCVKGCITENDKGFVSRNLSGLCDVCVIICFVRINDLCDYLVCVLVVCVKGWNTENDKWFVGRDLSGLCEWVVCVTQTIYSHKPENHTNQIICNTKKDKRFVWRGGLCEGMVCVKGWFVWRDVIQRMINGLCEGMVCVKGCNIIGFVWRDMMNGL